MEHSLSPAEQSPLCSTGVSATVTIMDNISLLLLNLPTMEGCEPLWRTFHHRAVGALLLGEKGAESERILGPVADFLRERKIPFAAMLLGGPPDAAKEGGLEVPRPQADDNPSERIPWQNLDATHPDVTRRTLRGLFEAILGT